MNKKSGLENLVCTIKDKYNGFLNNLKNNAKKYVLIASLPLVFYNNSSGKCCDCNKNDIKYLNGKIYVNRIVEVVYIDDLSFYNSNMSYEDYFKRKIVGSEENVCTLLANLYEQIKKEVVSHDDRSAPNGSYVYAAHLLAWNLENCPKIAEKTGASEEEIKEAIYNMLIRQVREFYDSAKNNSDNRYRLIDLIIHAEAAYKVKKTQELKDILIEAYNEKIKKLKSYNNPNFYEGKIREYDKKLKNLQNNQKKK